MPHQTARALVAVVLAAVAIAAVGAGAVHAVRIAGGPEKALRPSAAALLRRHRALRRPAADANADSDSDAGADADTDTDADAAVDGADAVLMQLHAAKPRDRLNRDRAAASSDARAAAHRAATAAAAAPARGTGRLSRPANAPRPPSPPVPHAGISAQRLVRGNGRRHARTNQPPPSPLRTPRFVATHTAAGGKAGAKTKNFEWTQEGAWHGLTAGEDDDEVQPPWVNGPDPLPKHVAEPFTPPKAPTMGFQGDGRFYPPPPPPPPPPPSPYPPPPPPPPPGGGADAGPEGEDDFLEKSAHVHSGDAGGSAVPRRRWVPPNPETLKSNSVQFPFHLFPQPRAGAPGAPTQPPLPPLPQPTAPGAAAPGAGAGSAAPAMAPPAPLSPPQSMGGFDASHTVDAAPAARPNGFGLPMAGAAGAAAASSDDSEDSFAAFNRHVNAAVSGGAVGGSLQAQDAARLRQIEFEREMAAAEREQSARDSEREWASHVQAMQSLAAQQQEPLSSASSAFGPEPTEFPTHALQQPPM